MIVIVGMICVLVAVLVGFTMAGGNIAALIHPSELITIGGAALGALIIMSPKRVLIDLARGVVQVVKGTPYKKAMYVDLFKLLFSLARVARRDGFLPLESHVGNAAGSAIFNQHPVFAKNHHATQFLC